MKLTFTLFGLMIGLISGYYISIFGIDFILASMLDNVAIVIAICVIAFALIIAVYASAERILHLYFGVRPRSVAETVASAINMLVNSIPQLSTENKAEVRLALNAIASTYANLLLRSYIFRAFILVALATSGTIATYVLLKQNTILEEQTGRFDTQNSLLNDQIERLGLQNELLQTQALMQDANRYSAYTGIVTDVVRRVFEAGANRENRFDVTNLNDAFVTEIRSLLTQLGPYTYVEQSQTSAGISTVFLSPEKGHILRALIENNVNFFDFSEADFSYADMRRVNLSTSSVGSISRVQDFPCGYAPDPDVDFREIDLSNTDWSGANLGAVKLAIGENTVLRGASIDESVIEINSTTGLDFSQFELINSSVMSNVPVSLEDLHMSTQFDYLLSPCVGAIGDDMSLMSVGATIDPLGFELSLYGYIDIDFEDETNLDWERLDRSFEDRGFDGLSEILRVIYESHSSGEPLSSEFVLNHVLGHTYLLREEDWSKIYTIDPQRLIANVSHYSIDPRGNMSIKLEVLSADTR